LVISHTVIITEVTVSVKLLCNENGGEKKFLRRKFCKSVHHVT